MTETANLPAPRSTTEAQITELTAKLRPAEDHAIARIITGLLDFGFVVPSSIPAKSFNDKYRFALQGISETALKLTAAKLVKGEYPEQNSNFLPIPAEFAKLARREERPIRDDRLRLRERLEGASAAERPEPRDPAIGQRIRALAAQTVQDLRSTSGVVAEEFVTEERAEELRRIMALRDAPSVSAEQQARQRKASADLERFEREHGDESQV